MAEDQKATGKTLPPRQRQRVNGPVLPAVPAKSGAVKKQTRKERVAVWQGPGRKARLDTAVAAMIRETRKKTGNSRVFAVGELESSVIVLPMPSVALEWLMGNSGFPLGCVTAVIGQPGVKKSSFIFEIFRWFRQAGGTNVLEENETKFSPNLLLSMHEYDNNAVYVDQTQTIEEWQANLQGWITKFKDLCTGSKQEPGPGRVVPVCFAIDSLTGKTMAETQDKIEEEGSAGRAHPIDALSLSSYLKILPHKLEGWPFSLLWVKHLKKKVSQSRTGGHEEEDHTPGGAAPDFHETLRFRLSAWKSSVQSSEFEGSGIRIYAGKNALGPDKRAIRTRFLWKQDLWPNPKDPDGPQVRRQRSWWDWNWTTATFLADLIMPKSEKTNAEVYRGVDRELIREACPVYYATKGDTTATGWSPRLGITKDKAIPMAELGRQIQEDPTVLSDIRNALGIIERPVFTGDEPFDRLQERLREELP